MRTSIQIYAATSFPFWPSWLVACAAAWICMISALLPSICVCSPWMCFSWRSLFLSAHSYSREMVGDALKDGGGGWGRVMRAGVGGLVGDAVSKENCEWNDGEWESGRAYSSFPINSSRPLTVPSASNFSCLSSTGPTSL